MLFGVVPGQLLGHPQCSLWLKPTSLMSLSGTTEVVPFPKLRPCQNRALPKTICWMLPASHSELVSPGNSVFLGDVIAIPGGNLDDHFAGLGDLRLAAETRV